MKSSSKRYIPYLLPLTFVVALSACQKNESSPSSQNATQPQAPETVEAFSEEPRIINPEAVKWRLKTETFDIVFENLGWQECGVEVCTLNDYTKIDDGKRVGYIYRVLTVGELNREVRSFWTNYHPSKDSTGDELFINDPSLWNKHTPAIIPLLEKDKTRLEWGNGITLSRLPSIMKAETGKYLDRCLSHPKNKELAERPIESFGNLLLRQEWVFWLDRHHARPWTALEINQKTGKLIAVSTLLMPERFNLNSYVRPEHRFRGLTTEAHINIERLAASSPMDFSDLDDFRTSCSEAYAMPALWHSSMFDQEYDLMASERLVVKPSDPPWRTIALVALDASIYETAERTELESKGKK